MASLRVADQYQASSRVTRNWRGKLAGERAFRFPVNVLHADEGVGALAERIGDCVERQRGREERDRPVRSPGVVHEKGPEERLRVRRTVIHFPVGGEYRFSQHHRRSSSASTPGSGLPSRNSSDAPPPVETWLIRLERPASSTAAAESPPPTIVVAPRSVASASASAIARVPASKGGVSNTPMGPFQSTVFAERITSANSRTERGPMSNMASSAGMAVRSTACADFGSSRERATVASVGSTSLRSDFASNA